MNKPLFICLEGLDGSGKTTQAKLLSESLQGVYTREPSDLPIGKLIRHYLQKLEIDIGHHSFQLMYAADRGEHVKKEILDNLKINKSVVTDRYFFSSIAFGVAMGLDFDWLNQINRYFPLPDFCFYLDTPIDLCLKRINIRIGNQTRELFEKKEILRKVADSYQKIIENYEKIASIHPNLSQGSKLYKINGNQTMEKINQDILEIININHVQF